MLVHICVCGETNVEVITLRPRAKIESCNYEITNKIISQRHETKHLRFNILCDIHKLLKRKVTFYALISYAKYINY